MSTIKDVAETAGVSKTLVSRFLNNKKGVSPKSKEKIIEAITNLNYRPNGIARSLVLQKTHSIGIVVDNICSPFIFRLISGLERGAEDFDKGDKYNVVFCNSNGDINRKKRHIQFMTEGRVDGIVIYGSFIHDDSIIKQLADSTFPFILIENDLGEIDVNKIIIDNTEGAFKATEYLIKSGHKKIAHIGGNLNLKITTDRMNGYLQALQKYNIPVDNKMVILPDFMAYTRSEPEEADGQRIFNEVGYYEMKKIIEAKNIPDAIFFATDLSAFGAVKAIREAGLRVPADISIIGFDDESPTSYDFLCEPLTTMRQPLYEAGYTGIKKLIDNIENPQSIKERIVLKAELIIRKSCMNR